MDGYQNQEEFEADQEEFEPWDWIYYCNKVKISLSFWILNVIVQCFNVLN
jgi:Zn-dependent oligopeptidase